jgi:hypothetical protein
VIYDRKNNKLDKPVLDYYEGIPSQYLDYMLASFPQTRLDQWLKCLEFSEKMQGKFPELELKKGYVFSHENIDNHDPDHPVQYAHAWLLDETGLKIDPTVLQFSLLGELQYVEAGHPTGKCMGCGDMMYDNQYVYCGKCKWGKKKKRSVGEL